ncbi:MAG TPA: hypothetical protein VHN80_12685 [Kineosporiaceae bacterium]|nr:hypothetical protein [Kineosporiaceae bacterium]
MTPDPVTGTVGVAGVAQTGGRDPSRAIAVKKQQAAANRDKIAATIAVLQRDGQPINVQSVARAAGVHPHTIRRNPDLMKEVQRLRDSGWQRPPVIHADPTVAASYKALKARLLASQAEVADLRRDLAQLRRDAHQALGTAPARSDPTIVEDLQRQTAELRVQLMNERDTTGSLQAAVAANAEGLTAAHEIARGYLRELNQTKDELLHTRRELVKLRTKASTASVPTPTSATDHDAQGSGRTEAGGRVITLGEQLGPGWRLVQDGDRAEQRWHLEHDQVRVGMVRRAVTTRGRTAWSARSLDGYEVQAPDAFAATAGSRLWRTRDLAAAGLAQHSRPH